MLFMVIETFRDGDPKPVYQRLREKGRQMPAGLHYIDSWVDADFARCFQLVECDDVDLLGEWASAWEDLVMFEFVPVIPSHQAVEAIERQQ
ncbi:MAG: DUF3303 family protein [Alphaproteobacteria bacterium]|nr:DUF3303 family protein [Alphaproteobacteria bacterium]